MKCLADFDLSAAPTVNPATIATLAGGSYLDAGDPVVLLGDSGTGKSHLLIGLGIAACEQGRRVRYVTCAQPGPRATGCERRAPRRQAEAGGQGDRRQLPARLIAPPLRVDGFVLDRLNSSQGVFDHTFRQPNRVLVHVVGQPFGPDEGAVRVLHRSGLPAAEPTRRQAHERARDRSRGYA